MGAMTGDAEDAMACARDGMTCVMAAGWQRGVLARVIGRRDACGTRRGSGGAGGEAFGWWTADESGDREARLKPAV